MEKGYVKLFRKIWENELVIKHGTDGVAFLVYLITSANHEQKRWKNLTIRPGEFLFSMRSAARKLRIGDKKIRILLANCEALGIVGTLKGTLGTLIKLHNYAKYQESKLKRGTLKGTQVSLGNDRRIHYTRISKDTSSPTAPPYLMEPKQKKVQDTLRRLRDLAKSYAGMTVLINWGKDGAAVGRALKSGFSDEKLEMLWKDYLESRKCSEHGPNIAVALSVNSINQWENGGFPQDKNAPPAWRLK